MRPEKAIIVSDVQEKLQKSPFLLIADYSGMQVKHFELLRTRLSGVGAEVHVVKNTFIKRAIKELGLPELNEALTGQSAMVTGESDICGAAKVIKTFVAEFTKPPIKVGILDNAILSAAQVGELADLPSKEVLQGKLLGLLLAPATQFVRVLNEPGSSLARVLKAKAEQGGGVEEAPTASEEAAPEAPAAEAPATPAVEAPAAPAAEAPAAPAAE
jgi:large subunit ribosomal protein L10